MELTKLDELIYLLEINYINELKCLNEKIINNDTIKDNFKLLNTLDIYSTQYKDLKHELLSNEDVKRYLFLESELNLHLMYLNSSLNKLKGKGGCSNACN